MLFWKRYVLALKAIRWCEEHNVQPTPFNIVAAVNSFGLLKGEAVEQSAQADGSQATTFGGSATNDADAAWEALHVSRRR